MFTGRTEANWAKLQMWCWIKGRKNRAESWRKQWKWRVKVTPAGRNKWRWKQLSGRMVQSGWFGWKLALSTPRGPDFFLFCQRWTVETAARDNWSGPWHPSQASLNRRAEKNVSHGFKTRQQKSLSLFTTGCVWEAEMTNVHRNGWCDASKKFQPPKPP